MTEWRDITDIWILSTLVYIIFLLTNNVVSLIFTLFGSVVALLMMITNAYFDFVEWRKNKKRKTTSVV